MPLLSCNNCDTLFMGKSGRKFCCRSCASKYNNTGKTLSDETKKKISDIRKSKGLSSGAKNPNSRHTIETVRLFLSDIGYTLISNEYVNNKGVLNMICDKGHNISMSYFSLLQGSRCIVCSGKQKHTYEYVREYISSFGYTLISDEYKNAQLKISIMCDKGHEYDVKFNNFKNGQRCAICTRLLKSSRPEKEIFYYVSDIYDGCVVNNDRSQMINPISGYGIELDIYLPDIKKAIEYNGRYWHSFPDTIIKDKIKQDMCMDMGIDLLVINECEWNGNKTLCLENIQRFIYEN